MSQQSIATTSLATRGKIAEALGVAIAVNTGAPLVYSARVMDAFSVKQA